MIKSNYVIPIDGENAFFLYSGLSGALLSFPRSERERIISFIDNPDKILDPNLFNELYKKEFIVADRAQEKGIISKRRNDAFRYKSDYQTFIIATTFDCNLKCPYCYQKYMKADNKKTLAEKDLGMIEYFVENNFSSKKSIHVTWYGGEPLLNTKSIEHLSKFFISKYGKNNYTSHVITNGTLIDKNIIDLFQNSNISSVQITIDGDEYTHNKRRSNGKETYFTIMENVNLLLESGIEVVIRINVEKENIYAYRDVMKSFSSSAHKNMITMFPKPTKHASKDLRMTLEDEAHLAIESLKDIIKYGFNNSIEIPKPFPCSCDFFSETIINISPDCNIWSCIEELGDYSCNNVKPICNLSNYSERIIDGFHAQNKHLKEIPSDCFECKVIPVCLCGCPREKINRTGLHSLNDCTFYKLCVEEYIKIIGDHYYSLMNKESN
jgi:uncharacterized protein